MAKAATTRKGKPKVGDVLIFNGYADTSVPEGEDKFEPIFTQGDRVIVVAVDKDDPDDLEVKAEDDDGKVDNVFFGKEASFPAAKKANGKSAPKKTAAAAKAKGGKPAAKAKAKAKAKATPKAPAKTKQPVEEITNIIDTPEVAAVLKKSKNALEAASSLIRQAEETYFSLGGVLAHIKKEGAYKSLKGYDENEGFALYCKDHLNLDYRKAQYLIQIYQHWTQNGLDHSNLAKIGYSKAVILTKVINKKNEKRLVSFAASNSREKLAEHVDELTAKGEGKQPTKPKVTRKTFRFRMLGESVATVESILARASKETENKTMEETFLMIVTEWATLKENVEVSLDEQIGVLESKFGVKLQQVEE